MFTAYLFCLVNFAFRAQAQANIAVYPITEVNEANHEGYFSDPYHVPYANASEVYISGTTHKYLECDSSLQPKCASSHSDKYNSSQAIYDQADNANATICGAAGIHPFQSGSGTNRTWDAVVTLHVQNTSNCDGIKGWSVIVHAHPSNSSEAGLPPTSWIGDQVLIGSFSKDEDANYDGKYFKTPAGKLYLVYSKRYSHKPPKRDGLAAWPMDDPRTMTPGSKPRFLLRPNDDLNSENYANYSSAGDRFKLLETGNIRAINGKFLMAYSAGAYDLDTYKVGIAYSDTFLPPDDSRIWRKVMKENPDHLWNSTGAKEVYYLLQADQKHDGWHYVRDQVIAPGVPTVAQIGPNGSWVLTFAGYDPQDAPTNSNNHYNASHRRPYFIDINVNVPVNVSVEEASDAELQGWITPIHG